MPTQKTGTTPQQKPAASTTDETITVGGRQMRRVNMGEFANQAFDGIVGASLGDPKPTEHETDPQQRKSVDAMLPEFLRDQQDAAESKEKMELMAKLSDRAIEARKRGDDALAEELKKALSDILGSSKPKRIFKKKPEHPALMKLKRNLGLKKIKPATVEWAGQKWHFAPAPPLVDNWVAIAMEQGIGSHAGRKIAASLIGLDDAPIYEVLGIDLIGTFDIDGQTISQSIYDKSCDACGNTVQVDAIVCSECDSILDPFDMPLGLRMEATQKIHSFLMQDFGPYEELVKLYGFMREVMPDRVFDKEALYGPFLKLSPESSTETAISPFGDEQ